MVPSFPSNFWYEELQNNNNRITKQFFASLNKRKNKGKSRTVSPDEKKAIDQIKKNLSEIQRMSREKIELAKKCFAFCEANLNLINKKMSSMDEKMKKHSLDFKKSAFRQGKSGWGKEEEEDLVEYGSLTKKVQKSSKLMLITFAEKSKSSFNLKSKALKK